LSRIEGYEELKRRLEKLERLPIEQALAQFGLLVASEAKKHAPVDTGRLRNSITALQTGKEVRVGTNVNYAKFVELGHRAEIVPVKAKALRFFVRGVGWVFAKRVVQGLTGKSASWEKEGDIIRKPFLKPAFEFAKETAEKFFRSFIEKVLRGDIG
jgi:HK97 gp10 family phage protein